LPLVKFQPSYIQEPGDMIPIQTCFSDCPKILCDFLIIIGETENRTSKPITIHVYHPILFDDLYYYCSWNSVVK